MKVVRCKVCGGHPMEMPREGVGVECRCRQSAWVQIDDDVLFVWLDVEVVGKIPKRRDILVRPEGCLIV